jgi:hypothetical protein
MALRLRGWPTVLLNAPYRVAERGRRVRRAAPRRCRRGFTLGSAERALQARERVRNRNEGGTGLGCRDGEMGPGLGYAGIGNALYS